MHNIIKFLILHIMQISIPAHIPEIVNLVANLQSTPIIILNLFLLQQIKDFNSLVLSQDFFDIMLIFLFMIFLCSHTILMTKNIIFFNFYQKCTRYQKNPMTKLSCMYQKAAAKISCKSVNICRFQVCESTEKGHFATTF